jgi:hypothetical protein
LPGHGGATNGAAENPHQGDADLNGGEKLVGRIGKSQGCSGGSIACLSHLLKAMATGRNDGDFSSRENTVRYDQHQDGQDLQRQGMDCPRKLAPIYSDSSSASAP